MSAFTGTDRFSIRRRLGSGGFGVVYEAFDFERQTLVALKVPHDAGTRDVSQFKQEFRALADVIGEEALGPLDRQYLKFGETFEHRFLAQGETENRPIATTLDLGWEILSTLPKEELHRVSDELLEQHYKT